MSKMGIVIQARLGSTRLPKKVLLPLPTGETVLERIIKTCLQFGDRVALTTPDRDVRNEAEKHLDMVYLYEDKKRNVHQEIVSAAVKSGFEHVIRITGDCPLLEYDDIVCAVQAYRLNYLYHGPDGHDVEIFPLDQFIELEPDNDVPTAGFHHNGLSLATKEDYDKICQILRNKNTV